MSTKLRIERERPPDPEAMAAAIEAFVRAAGFDPQSTEHLRITGGSVAEAWQNDLLSGHDQDPEAALGLPFDVDSSELVVVRDIQFHSSCPHHLLPYLGTAHVAYLPDRKAVGFSNLVKLLDVLAHRLTLQEWLTRDVVDVLDRVLEPRGSACVLEAVPMCAAARGVKRPCTVRTTAFTGVFEADAGLRSDLLRQLAG